jgi:high-affinity nickel-transport protein
MDKNRVHSAHFEPLSQDTAGVQIDEEQLQSPPTMSREGLKDPNVIIEPVEATDIAGPAHR